LVGFVTMGSEAKSSRPNPSATSIEANAFAGFLLSCSESDEK